MISQFSFILLISNLILIDTPHKINSTRSIKVLETCAQCAILMAKE